MDQKIFDYLQQNKGAYPKEILIAELRKVGHAESNIKEAVNYFFGNDFDLQVPVPQVFIFWDFKTKIIYQNSSQKWKDFLFGFFVPFVGNLFSIGIPMLGIIFSLVMFAVEIFSIFYLWNRRRFIVFGLLTSFGLSICLVILMLVIFVGIGFGVNK